MKYKIIKDSIHGYIKVPEIYFKIIDSAEFQRLKNIEQTSYRVLYPSARHDRFVHSIGTFHLGEKAFHCFLNNLKIDAKDVFDELNKKNFWEICEASFVVACLLHDVGHSPFSHTCEHFFIQKKSPNCEPQIYYDLKQAIKKLYAPEDERYNKFENDFKTLLRNKKPSPHEIISATILINVFGKFIIDELSGDPEFSARMIIGCTYLRTVNYEVGVKNCLIRMLNSQTVDVDKLDYITRDTGMSGFDNVSVDIERLLSSLSIVKNQNDILLAFGKNALSTLENVVNAKNAQSKWIINHPSVTYEAYLIKTAIKRISDKISINGANFIETVFSMDALSKEGVCFNSITYKLFSDADLYILFKQHMDIEEVAELIDRSKRKHPIWKSYAEYNLMFCDSTPPRPNYSYNSFEYCFRTLINYIDNADVSSLDSTILEIISQKPTKDDDTVKEAFGILSSFASSANVDNKYVIIEAKNEFAAHIDGEKVLIKFPEFPELLTYNKVFGISMNSKSEVKPFFYIYNVSRINKKHFSDFIQSQQYDIIK